MSADRSDSFSIGMRGSATSLAIIGAFVCLTGGDASADSRVQVVEVELAADVVVDPTCRERIDETLRAAAELEPRWRVVPSTLGRDRLRAESGCDVVDDACLERVAERRSVDRLVVPTLRRIVPTPEGDSTSTATTDGVAAGAASTADEADDDDAVYELSLALFDAYTRRTREVWSGRIEADDVDSHRALGRLANKLVSLLGRMPEEGTTVVRAVAGAEVFLDERSMGIVPASGELVVPGLRIGRRELRVVRPSRSVWEAPIIVRPRESISVTVDSGAALASFESGAPTVEHRGATLARTLELPEEWDLVPSLEPTGTTEVLEEPDVSAAPGAFHLPVLEEHLVRGEFRTTTHARVGFLPNVSSSGARVTAKLRF